MLCSGCGSEKAFWIRRFGRFERCSECSPDEGVPRQGSRIALLLDARGISGTGTDFRPGVSQEALCREWEKNGVIKGAEAAWWKKVTDNWKASDENVRKGLTPDGKTSLARAALGDEITVEADGKIRDRDGNKTDYVAEPVADAENSVPWPVQNGG